MKKDRTLVQRAALLALANGDTLGILGRRVCAAITNGEALAPEDRARLEKYLSGPAARTAETYAKRHQKKVSA